MCDKHLFIFDANNKSYRMQSFNTPALEVDYKINSAENVNGFKIVTIETHNTSFQEIHVIAGQLNCDILEF